MPLSTSAVAVPTNRSAVRKTAAVSTLLFAGTLGAAANASVVNVSNVYSYFGVNSSVMNPSAPSQFSPFVDTAAGFANSQSLLSSSFSNPSGGNLSMVRTGLSSTGFNLSFTQNTSGLASWGARISFEFTVTADTSLALSGWLMGRGWGEEDWVQLRNVTDNTSMYEIINRANLFAPVGTVQQFNTTQSLVTGKTYSLDWRTETTVGGGADQNPNAGFTALSFGVATAPVPGAGLASLGTLGLAAFARRRRR